MRTYLSVAAYSAGIGGLAWLGGRAAELILYQNAAAVMAGVVGFLLCAAGVLLLGLRIANGILEVV